jgi:hypothetical protein
MFCRHSIMPPRTRIQAGESSHAVSQSLPLQDPACPVRIGTKWVRRQKDRQRERGLGLYYTRDVKRGEWLTDVPVMGLWEEGVVYTQNTFVLDFPGVPTFYTKVDKRRSDLWNCTKAGHLCNHTRLARTTAMLRARANPTAPFGVEAYITAGGKRSNACRPGGVAGSEVLVYYGSRAHSWLKKKKKSKHFSSQQARSRSGKFKANPVASRVSVDSA